MKKFWITLSLVSLFGFLQLEAQLNVNYISDLPYDADLSDIWGWAAPDGTEYALVGVRNGFSIVSLEDPENPYEAAFIPGPSTTWRDIKTWDHYAYVTNEGGDGLLVVNLENLPDGLTNDDWFYWAPDLPGLGTLSTIHNLYIDEFGTCYLAGANINSGGVLYVDVATDPFGPQFVGAGPPIYSHDVYARDNFLYSSEIYQGVFAIYDVSDLTNPALVNTQSTGATFTHNTWLSDDGNTIFTTDELANAPCGSYDISDKNDIKELNQFRPLTTLGVGVIPHNVHVWNDYIIISYYTDGCIIVDASVPDNLIEVGNFDTYIPANTGFSGAWGAYPFLPSGLVLVTDIGNGLYVLEPNYVRAARLQGIVTDSETQDNIAGVDVSMDAVELNQSVTNVSGEYKTGVATAGTFDVTFTKLGYFPKTVSATLVNGEITILDVELDPMPNFMVTGQVVRSDNGDPIPNAKVLVFNNTTSFESVSDGNGNFSLNGLIGGQYDIFAGSWGYLHNKVEIDLNQPTSVVIELDEGYQDDFFTDFNWKLAENSAETGNWEMGEPVGTTYQGGEANPELDVLNDYGDMCYVTGNGGGSAGNDDVDNGFTVLISPAMELLSKYEYPVFNYSLWFFNDGGNGDPDDKLEVGVTNGTDEVIIREITETQNSWEVYSDTLKDIIELTDDMSIFLRTSDLPGSGHLLEAGFDAFLVTDTTTATTTAINAISDNNTRLSAFPNPSISNTFVTVEMTEMLEEAQLVVYDVNGRKVSSIAVNQPNAVIELDDLPHAGIFFVRLESTNSNSEMLKIVKQ